VDQGSADVAMDVDVEDIRLLPIVDTRQPRPSTNKRWITPAIAPSTGSLSLRVRSSCGMWMIHKIWGGPKWQKRAKFGAILDNFKLRSQISPEQITSSQIFHKLLSNEAIKTRHEGSGEW